MTTTDHTLEVPGASLHYQLRGSGPLLALIANPMGSSGFTALADLMATDHTVLTYDPRGSARSTVTDRTEATTPELLASDGYRVITAVTDQPVTILGSSGGAVTGLALVTAHPELVSVLVAHEPPLLTLLSDTEQQLGVVDHIRQTYREAGGEMAMREFLLAIGVLGDQGSRELADSPLPAATPAPAVPADDNDFFYANQLGPTTSYRPDLAALRAAPTRIVVGVGETSAGQLAHRGGLAFAAALGVPVTPFPGDHGGFAGQAAAFADRLRAVLTI
jgi:pimeloyl-ACP methyl ester carboxylesterase